MKMFTSEKAKRLFDLAMEIVYQNLGENGEADDCNCNVYFKDWNTEPLFEQYVQNKGWLFEYFDDEGRIEVKCESAFEDMFQIKELAFAMIKDLLPSIKEKYKPRHATPLNWHSDVLEATFELLLDRLTVSEVVNNAFAEDLELQADRYMPVSMNFVKGQKVSKALCAIRKEYTDATTEEDIKHNHDIQQKMLALVTSRFMQAVKVGETCCISINPVDILLSSSHAGFHSCHALDGCYRAGVLSNMVEGTTIVAYTYTLKRLLEDYDRYKSFSYDELRIPYKTWRQNVFLDAENYAAVMFREFDGMKVTAAKTARKLTADLLKKIADKKGREYEQKYLVRRSRYGDDDDCTTSLDSVQCNHEGYGYGGDAPTSVIMLKPAERKVYVTYGSPYKCPVCGSMREHGEKSNNFICDECTQAERFFCEVCGDECSEGDGGICESCRCNGYGYCHGCGSTAILRDNGYCDECFDDMFFECERCHRIERKEDCNEIQIGENDVMHVCYDCSKYYSTCEDCSNMYPEEDVTVVREGATLISVCNKCLENRTAHCSVCGNEITLSDAELDSDYFPVCKECSKDILETYNCKRLHKSKLYRYDYPIIENGTLICTLDMYAKKSEVDECSEMILVNIYHDLASESTVYRQTNATKGTYKYILEINSAVKEAMTLLDEPVSVPLMYQQYSGSQGYDESVSKVMIYGVLYAKEVE